MLMTNRDCPVATVVGRQTKLLTNALTYVFIVNMILQILYTEPVDLSKGELVETRGDPTKDHDGLLHNKYCHRCSILVILKST